MPSTKKVKPEAKAVDHESLLGCSKHPTYQAEFKPRANCLDCWIQWAAAHPDATIKGRDLLWLMRHFRVLKRVMQTGQADAARGLRQGE